MDPVAIAAFGALAGLGGFAGKLVLAWIADALKQRDAANARADRYLEGWQSATKAVDQQAGTIEALQARIRILEAS